MTETARRDGKPRIGVLALQGDFREHMEALRRLDVEAVEVRKAGQLLNLDGIIIPGGESTTITKLLKDFDLVEPVREFERQGKAVWGTCAGMIVISKETTDLPSAKPLGFIDISVRRNAYGRQVDSFEEDIPIPSLGERPFHCVFIRAPSISKTGKKVDVLAQTPDGTPIAVRQGHVLATSFHPELTQDTRFHALFVRMARREDGKQR
jgi:5'-phosphate synthase pdxT subunit